MHKKGKKVQNCSLLLKIAMDVITFKYDYWFVLEGETFMRNQNTAHYAKLPQKYLYQKQLKWIQLTEKGQKGPFRGDGNGILIEVSWVYAFVRFGELFT